MRRHLLRERGTLPAAWRDTGLAAHSRVATAEWDGLTPRNGSSVQWTAAGQAEDNGTADLSKLKGHFQRASQDEWGRIRK